MNNLKYIDLFCGLGGFHIAMENLKKQNFVDSECTMACDIDKKVREVYKLNWGITPEEDVTKLQPEKMEDFDELELN